MKSNLEMETFSGLIGSKSDHHSSVTRVLQVFGLPGPVEGLREERLQLKGSTGVFRSSLEAFVLIRTL